MAEKKAILDMLGFGCPSCAYALERLGRKLEGIRDIRVDLSTHEIRVTYEGDDRVLEQVRALVNQIGHDAKVRL